MAITVPSTNIQFFSDLGISPAYENSLYFANEAAKDNYFNGLQKRAVFSSCTYQRENRGYIRVQCNISLLYNVDYMRFQNPDFENKWFYAFVNQINYINNNTTEVQYEIDPLITWMGVFNLKKCYVERQHVRNDNIGANICDEGLPTGEYVIENKFPTFDMYSYGSAGTQKIAIVIGNETGQMNGGLYQGCNVQICDTVAQANDIIKTLVETNRSEEIVSIYTFPSEFNTTGKDAVVKKTYTYAKPYETVSGYSPKNKKLFCYPYKYVEVDNTEGQTQQYMYEYFNTIPYNTSSGNFAFDVIGASGANCELLLMPSNYKIYHVEETSKLIPNHTLGMSHFPLASWGVDAYKAWLAQKNAYFPMQREINAQKSMINGAVAGGVRGGLSGAALGAATGTLFAPGVGTVLGAIAGGATGAMIGASVAGASSVAKDTLENLTENRYNIVTSDENKGEQSTDVLAGYGQKTFQIIEKAITKNYAIMIDNYFTMYGYAIKQVLTPSMNVREHYTYVKTIGCNVGGNLPAADARVIEKIFDNGIRFWKNHTEIGNYDLDNSAVVG